MQKISDIIKHNNLSTISGSPAKPVQNQQAKVVSSQAKQCHENSEIIDRLFLRLAVLYGNTWRNLYKNNEFLMFAKAEWRDALVGYEEKLLYQALNICREHHKFPPTVPEFIECCKELTRKKVFFKVENHDKANPTVAATHLNKIKAILNMKP